MDQLTVAQRFGILDQIMLPRVTLGAYGQQVVPQKRRRVQPVGNRVAAIDRHIRVAFFILITDEVVAAAYVQGNVGMLVLKSRQQRQQPATRDGRGAGDDEIPLQLRLLNISDGFVDLLEAGVQRAVQRLPFFGQDDLARQAMKKRKTQFLLKAAYSMAHRTLGDAQILSRLCKAHVLGYDRKRVQELPGHLEFILVHAFIS